MTDTNSAYKHLSLQELTANIHKEHYKIISLLCGHIDAQITDLYTKELPVHSIAYVAASSNYIKEVEYYIKERTLISIPYITSLAEKNATGHNCADCAGSCEVEHSETAMNFNAWMLQLKANCALYEKASLETYIAYNLEKIKELNHKMSQLQSRVIELLYIEEQYLLPGIKRAHEIINAISSV